MVKKVVKVRREILREEKDEEEGRRKEEEEGKIFERSNSENWG